MGNAEANARRLMTALVADGYSVGDAIRNAQLQVIAAGIGMDLPEQEQEAAIAFAGGRGWIANGLRPGTIILTQAGGDIGNA